MPQVNPEILVWARETAALDRAEAARKLGFKDSAKSSAEAKLAALETGAREPTRAQLGRMAEQYRRPLLTFYLPQPPRKGDRGADFRSLQRETSPREEALLDALLREIQARQSMVRFLLEEDEAAPLTFIGCRSAADGRRSVLAALQGLLNVPLAEYREQRTAKEAFDLLRERAEQAGVFVILQGNLGSHHTNIEVATFRGFSIADDLAPFIVINTNDARPALSFTLLHELVHLLLGQTGVGGEYSDDENEVERFCNGVAGEFLLPMEDLDELLPGGVADFDAMAERIGAFAEKINVSRSMVAYRAAAAGLIGWGTYGRLNALFGRQWREEQEQARVRSRGAGGGPSYYLVRKHSLGSPILELVRRTLADGTLSVSRAARILGVKLLQVYPLLDA